MTVRYLDLTDYLAIAAEITGLDVDTLSRMTRLQLADSALHAPAAGWGQDDLYPDFTSAYDGTLQLSKRTVPYRPFQGHGTPTARIP